MSTVNEPELINGHDMINHKIANGDTSPHQKKFFGKVSPKTSEIDQSGSASDTQIKKYMKNSRRSRSRFGRGLAKKGGAGGKGTWGKICEDYDADNTEVLDPNDPNYDSDSMEDCKIEAITPVLDENEIEQYVKPIITEYYEHCNTEEVIESLLDLNFGDQLFMIIVIAVSLAMERKNANREMTSLLISDLYGNVVHQEDIEKAFDVLLEMLPDLMLDTPNADELLGNFIARAVADDCIPPIYVKRTKEVWLDKPQKFSIELTHNLLSNKHGLINVDRIWGFTGGWRPVKYLIKQMHLILEEYIVSNLASDAGSNLTDLEVPHFHHEFAYEAIVKAIEDSKGTTIERICQLLKHLFDSGVLTVDQLKNGFLRVFEEMPDIVIDVPFAYDILDDIKNRSKKLGFFPEELESEYPTRGRKRFVSEGDGGLIKS